jgi:hypothetical protein
MNMQKSSFFFFYFLVFILLLNSCTNSIPHSPDNRSTRLQFEKKGENWTLIREGKPYYIKGAHGISKMEWVKELGGNSVIAYHYQVSDSLLDLASRLGLTVSVILDIEKPRFGADYSNKEFLENQRNWISSLVNKYKNHEALLFWIIGNEAHLMKKNNISLWREVNRISKMIHELDTVHLTTTTIASYPTMSYQPLQVKLLAPDLDFLSLTVYEFAHRIKRETRNIVWGWDGPYMVSEWSGDPFWILPHSEWEAVIEKSSTESAKKLLHQYHVIFERDPERCIGGYVFYWGQKQERTHTVFSLILEDRYKTTSLESIGYCWSKKDPKNWCPRIESFNFNDIESTDNHYLNVGTDYSMAIGVYDPEKEPLKMKWEILEEGDYAGKWGGEHEKVPKRIAGSDSIITFTNTIRFKTPAHEGAYRIFLYVYDMHDNVATVNKPFYTLP